MAGTGYIDTNGNRHIISGMVTGELPKYTMAEYTALTNKPQNWICTDYDATSEYGINATEVKYDSNNSVKDMLDSEKENLATGVDISRCGKNRNLQLNVTPSSYAIHTLATKDRPIFTVNGLGRYKNTSNTYYPCHITIETNGVVSASYFNGTTVSPINNGTINASVCYMV